MRNVDPRRIAGALLLGFAVAFVSCGRSDKTDASARHYEVRGIVRGLAPDRRTIEIEHENIPGFMPSMTMPFTPREQKDIAHLRTGDAISFRLIVTADDALIAEVKPISADEVHLPKLTPPPATAGGKSDRLREGDRVPNFSLTNETGETITLANYQGHPWILTFIFTRCAMPKFCPLMSKNFATLQNALKAKGGPLPETRLLSISIDPQFDTPAILKEYGQHEGADPTIWNFATATPREIASLTRQFAVQTTPEGGTISHGLATALISPEGKILKVWRGNGWTPEEVLAALSAPL